MATAMATIILQIPLIITILLQLLSLGTAANNKSINTITTTTCNLPTFTPMNNTTAHASLISNATTVLTAPLAAPLYRNVTAAAGEAWVFPNSSSSSSGGANDDLGARDMSCECFDPDMRCCMPASSSDLAPFCIMPATGESTCCGDTFCVAGESCCGGGFCCPANTVCNPKLTGSGCCPIGAICSGPAICYDHASSDCSNLASPRQQQCCPADVPYCRDFEPNGLGCYVSSTTATSSSSSTTVPAMTPARTFDIFDASPPPPPSSPSPSSSPVSTSTSVVVTVTVLVVVSDQHGGVSLEFITPSSSSSGGGGASEGAAQEEEKTTTYEYVLDWPASSATAAAITDITMSGSSSDVSVEEGTKTEPKMEGSATGTANASTTSTSLSTTAQSTSPTLSSSSSTSTTTPLPQPTSPSPPKSESPLCYDPTANSHSPCPTTTTTTTSTSSSSGGGGGAFNPPGASIVSSQASKPPIPINLNLIKHTLSKILTSHPIVILLLLFELSSVVVV